MSIHIKSLAAAALTVASSLALAGCALDVTNPNAATQDVVVSTPAGVRAVAIGLQGRYGNAIEHAVWVPALVAGELGTLTNSQSQHREFQRFPTASLNTPRVESTNLDLVAFWSRQYATIRAADDVLASVETVQLAPGTRSGLAALARTLKAASLGTLSEAWQQVVLEPSAESPTFADRATTLARVLELLASARSDLAAQAPSTEFTGSVLLPGIDLPNTIRAYQARWSLAAGQYEQALTFANEVPATATSEFRYTTVDQNPVWGAIAGNRYFGAVATLRTGAEAGDTRVTRLFGPTAIDSLGGTRTLQVLPYRNPADAYPLFTQDELTLIRAEAHARQNRLPQALTELNRIRSGAGLAARTAAELATQQAVLDEILRQRRLSLFLSGLAWADLRRFGHTADARVAWLPYPEQERASNPNTPANP
ncbi:MAG: RagB/SusD family nutrient uptake outer membrane protein [Gemmatirosa sp.]